MEPVPSQGATTQQATLPCHSAGPTCCSRRLCLDAGHKSGTETAQASRRASVCGKLVGIAQQRAAHARHGALSSSDLGLTRERALSNSGACSGHTPPWALASGPPPCTPRAAHVAQLGEERFSDPASSSFLPGSTHTNFSAKILPLLTGLPLPRAPVNSLTVSRRRGPGSAEASTESRTKGRQSAMRLPSQRVRRMTVRVGWAHASAELAHCLPGRHCAVAMLRPHHRTRDPGRGRGGLHLWSSSCGGV